MVPSQAACFLICLVVSGIGKAGEGCPKIIVEFVMPVVEVVQVGRARVSESVDSEVIMMGGMPHHDAEGGLLRGKGTGSLRFQVRGK